MTLLLVFPLLLWCASLPGQTISSSIVGTVTDPADAVVPGASVQLTDQGTGGRHEGACQVR